MSQGMTLNTPTEETFKIIRKLIRFLLSKGLNEQGLFSGPETNNQEVQTVKRKLKIEKSSLDLSSYTKSPAVVADILLEYLALLPSPLLGCSNYDRFILAYHIKSVNDRMRVNRGIIDTMSPRYQTTVKQALTLLHRIAANQQQNNLSAHKLAGVFGTLFLRPKREEHYMRDDDNIVHKIMVDLINNFDELIEEKVGNENNEPSSEPLLNKLNSPQFNIAKPASPYGFHSGIHTQIQQQPPQIIDFSQSYGNEPLPTIPQLDNSGISPQGENDPSTPALDLPQDYSCSIPGQSISSKVQSIEINPIIELTPAPDLKQFNNIQDPV